MNNIKIKIIDFLNEFFKNQDIKIENFENEITTYEEYNKLIRFKDRFDMKDINKLNVFFGDFKLDTEKYSFKKKYGGFGELKILFKGDILKTRTSDIIVIGHIYVNFDQNKGNKQLILKFKNLSEMFRFISTLDENIVIDF